MRKKSSPDSPLKPVQSLASDTSVSHQLREMYILMVALHMSQRVGIDLETRELLELGRIIKDIAQTSDLQKRPENTLEDWQRIEKAARIVAGNE